MFRGILARITKEPTMEIEVGSIVASILEIVMYDWSGWHVGTGSRMMSCAAEARVEGRRHSHHPSHHQQGDGRVRLQIKSVLYQSTLPSTTFHRHPHCTCVTQRAPNTGTSTYARKSWGGHPWVIWHRKVPPSGLWLCGSASTWHWLLRARKERRGLLVVTGTHFLWDPRAAPTFHPLSTLRQRAQCRTFHFQLSTVVQIAARGSPAGLGRQRCDRVEARGGRSGSRIDGYAIFPGTSTQTGGMLAFLIVVSSQMRLRTSVWFQAC